MLVVRCSPAGCISALHPRTVVSSSFLGLRSPGSDLRCADSGLDLRDRGGSSLRFLGVHPRSRSSRPLSGLRGAVPVLRGSVSVLRVRSPFFEARFPFIGLQVPASISVSGGDLRCDSSVWILGVGPHRKYPVLDVRFPAFGLRTTSTVCVCGIGHGSMSPKEIHGVRFPAYNLFLCGFSSLCGLR